ncbi:MAG: YicC family protein [Phycisphaeraceae bacterium]|nr:YicC family protein [Phycisphaeraceae bacterium]
MTGFGQASGQIDGTQYTVELRSLNNRYLKTVLRLPEEILPLEAELEMLLRHHFDRGSVTLWVRRQQAEGAAAWKVSQETLRSYLERMEAVRRDLEAKGGQTSVELGSLLALPGVLVQPDGGMSAVEMARSVLPGLLKEACEKLTAMRQAEGKVIAADFAKHLGIIRQRLDVVQARAPQVVEEYHQRLRGRVEELLARAQLNVDHVELIREVAIYAERSDISEEISRLSGHLEQFEQIVGAKDGEPAGRTLEFLAQEMLREANTIASKSNDGQISRAIVEIKGTIDRIKEQSQNVE